MSQNAVMLENFEDQILLIAKQTCFQGFFICEIEDQMK